MKKLFPIALLLSGCSIYLDTSLGIPLGDTRTQTYYGGDPTQPTRDGFAGSGAIARIALQAERQLSPRVRGYCQLSHTSNTHSGWPYNKDAESYIHEVGCGARILITE